MVDQSTTGPLSMQEAVRALSQDERVANPDEDNRERDDGGRPEEGDDEQELVDALAEDEGDNPVEEPDEGPPEEPEQEPYAKGRFASDDAKTTLADGTVITLAELKKGSMLQSDYSRKTLALAEQNRAVEYYKTQVVERERSLQQHGEILAAVVQAFLPQPPDAAMINPQSGNFDMVTYMAQKEEYERKSQIVQQMVSNHQAMLARQAADAEWSRSQVRSQQANMLFERMPELAEPDTYQRFWVDAVNTVGSVGYTPEELDEVDDHRAYLILAKAIAFDRLTARRGQARLKTNGKPALLSGSARRSPDVVRSHEAKSAMAKLNKTGSVQDGIAAMIALEKVNNR